MAVETLTFGCRLNTVEAEVMRGYAEPHAGDDLVIVSTVEEVRAASVRIQQRVIRAGETLAEGRITAAFLTPDGRPTRQPRAWIDRFEAVRAATKEQE